jgi:hypothetical protein
MPGPLYCAEPMSVEGYTQPFVAGTRTGCGGRNCFYIHSTFPRGLRQKTRHNPEAGLGFAANQLQGESGALAPVTRDLPQPAH